MGDIVICGKENMEGAMNDLRKVRALLVPVPGTVDVGHDEEDIVPIKVEVTPAYAAWLKGRGKKGDVTIMQGESTAFSSSGPGKHAVQRLVNLSLATVKNLIEKGVPRDIALKFLPHEIYVAITAKSKSNGARRAKS